MLAVIGDSSSISTLLRLYSLSTKEIIGVGYDDIEKLEPSKYSGAIILGGEWTHSAAIKTLLSLGFDWRRVVTSAQFNRVHAMLARSLSTESKRSLAYELIRADLIERQWFAYPLILAVVQAERLGIKSITAIEFGVWYGDGLRNLANIGLFLQETTGIEVRCFGFDTGSGLPTVADWRDHPELWGVGDFVMPDLEALRNSLPQNASVIIGDIADTLPPFLRTLGADSPIGFVSLDVDTYSSSLSCLKLFSDADPRHLLPATMLYGDDTHSNIMFSEFAGEELAIKEFNLSNNLRKIDKKIVRTHSQQKPWHHTMYFAHVFDHPIRNKVGADLGPVFHWKY